MKTRADKQIADALGAAFRISGQQSVSENGSINSPVSETTDICIYRTPPYDFAAPLPGQLDKPAVDLHGKPSRLFRETSAANKDTGIINLSCISGKVNNIFYPADEPFFSGGTSKTCGYLYNAIQVPEDIQILNTSSATIKTRFHLPKNLPQNPVYALAKGNTNDVLAVTGWAWMEVTVMGHSNTIFDTSKIFLNMMNANGIEDGFYKNDFELSVDVPELTPAVTQFVIAFGVHINTYTSVQFNPGDTGLPSTEYALLDFRSGAEDEFPILPPALGERIGKKGPGGIRVSSIKLCLNNIVESSLLHPGSTADIERELEADFA